MGDRYGKSDNNYIWKGISIWDMCDQFEIWCIDMIIYHIDTVVLGIHMGYGLMMWEMTVSIWSSPISIWEILSLWSLPPGARLRTRWRGRSKSQTRAGCP